MAVPVVDEEFRALIPPLAGDELALLEANIAVAGRATDPLKTWRDVLLDGHNRLDICQRLKLPFDVIEVALASREHALLWIEENQLGRRNLSDDQRAAIVDRMVERKSRIVTEKRAVSAGEARAATASRDALGKMTSSLPDTSSGKLAVASGAPEPSAVITWPQGDGSLDSKQSAELWQAEQQRQEARREQRDGTRAAAAREHKIPERKMRAVAEIKKHDPAARERIARGETTIIQERAKLNAAARAAVAERTPTVPTGRYSCIVIDPPWPMEKIEREVRPNQVGFEYPTMSEEQLAAFPVEKMAEDDCHLFLWTTHKFLPMALRLLEKWGFRYICTFVWHKPGGFQPIGLPQYNCEFALYARRGSPKFIDTKQLFCCFSAGRREHSRKPDEFYSVIKRVTASPRIDVFSREKRDGFDQHGNETAKFVAAAE